MSLVNILIIEDNTDVIKMLQRVIQILGEPEKFSWHFGTRLTCLEEKYRELSPEVILCDISLPDGQSPATLQKLISSSPESTKSHLIAYSAYSDSDLAEHRDLFDDILPKSTDPMSVIKFCKSKSPTH